MDALKLRCENQSITQLGQRKDRNLLLLSKRVDKPFRQSAYDIGVDFYVTFLRVSLLCTVCCGVWVWNKGVAEPSSLQHC